MKKVTYMLMMLVAAGAAQAAFVTDWNNWMGVTTVTDATDAIVDNYRDITEMNHYYDGSTYHYFRLVFEGGVGTEIIGGATDYMINIDSGVGGQSSATSLYLATSLTGIDQIVDIHLGNASSFASAGPGHNHISSAGANGANINFTIAALSPDGDAQGGRSYLEWQIDKSILPSGSFTIIGGSHTIGGATYDVTSSAVVPEPATIGLFGIAVFMGLAFRRVRSYFEM